MTHARPNALSLAVALAISSSLIGTYAHGVRVKTETPLTGDSDETVSTTITLGVAQQTAEGIAATVVSLPADQVQQDNVPSLLGAALSIPGLSYKNDYQTDNGQPDGAAIGATHTVSLGEGVAAPFKVQFLVEDTDKVSVKVSVKSELLQGDAKEALKTETKDQYDPLTGLASPSLHKQILVRAASFKDTFQCDQYETIELTLQDQDQAVAVQKMVATLGLSKKPFGELRMRDPLNTKQGPQAVAGSMLGSVMLNLELMQALISGAVLNLVSDDGPQDVVALEDAVLKLGPVMPVVAEDSEELPDFPATMTKVTVNPGSAIQIATEDEGEGEITIVTKTHLVDPEAMMWASMEPFRAADEDNLDEESLVPVDSNAIFSRMRALTRLQHKALETLADDFKDNYELSAEHLRSLIWYEVKSGMLHVFLNNAPQNERITFHNSGPEYFEAALQTLEIDLLPVLLKQQFLDQNPDFEEMMNSTDFKTGLEQAFHAVVSASSIPTAALKDFQINLSKVRKEKTQQIISEYEKQAKKVQQLEADIDATEQQLEELQRTTGELRTNLEAKVKAAKQDLEQQLQTARADMQRLQERVAGHDELQERFTKLDEEFQENKQLLETANENLRKVTEEKDQLNNEFQEKAAKVTEQEEQLDELRQQLDQQKTAIEELRQQQPAVAGDQNADLQQQLETKQREHAELQKLYDELVEEQKTLTTDLAEANRKINTLTEAETEFQQQLDNTKRDLGVEVQQQKDLVAERNDEITRITAELDQKTTEITQKDAAITEKDNELERRQQRITELEELEETLTNEVAQGKTESQQELDRVKGELATAAEELEALKLTKGQLDTELAGLKEESEALNQQFADEQTAKQRAEEAAHDLRTQLATKEDLRLQQEQRADRLDGELTTVRAELDQKKLEAGNLQQQIDDLQQLPAAGDEDEAGQLRTQLITAQEQVGTLQQTETRLTEELRAANEAKANDEQQILQLEEQALTLTTDRDTALREEQTLNNRVTALTLEKEQIQLQHTNTQQTLTKAQNDLETTNDVLQQQNQKVLDLEEQVRGLRQQATTTGQNNQQQLRQVQQQLHEATQHQNQLQQRAEQAEGQVLLVREQANNLQQDLNRVTQEKDNAQRRANDLNTQLEEARRAPPVVGGHQPPVALDQRIAQELRDLQQHRDEIEQKSREREQAGINSRAKNRAITDKQRDIDAAEEGDKAALRDEKTALEREKQQFDQEFVRLNGEIQRHEQHRDRMEQALHQAADETQQFSTPKSVAARELYVRSQRVKEARATLKTKAQRYHELTGKNLAAVTRQDIGVDELPQAKPGDFAEPLATKLGSAQTFVQEYEQDTVTLTRQKQERDPLQQAVTDAQDIVRQAGRGATPEQRTAITDAQLALQQKDTDIKATEDLLTVMHKQVAPQVFARLGLERPKGTRRAPVTLEAEVAVVRAAEPDLQRALTDYQREKAQLEADILNDKGQLTERLGEFTIVQNTYDQIPGGAQFSPEQDGLVDHFETITASHTLSRAYSGMLSLVEFVSKHGIAGFNIDKIPFKSSPVLAVSVLKHRLNVGAAAQESEAHTDAWLLKVTEAAKTLADSTDEAMTLAEVYTAAVDSHEQTGPVKLFDLHVDGMKRSFSDEMVSMEKLDEATLKASFNKHADKVDHNTYAALSLLSEGIVSQEVFDAYIDGTLNDNDRLFFHHVLEDHHIDIALLDANIRAMNALDAYDEPDAEDEAPAVRDAGHSQHKDSFKQLARSHGIITAYGPAGAKVALRKFTKYSSMTVFNWVLDDIAYRKGKWTAQLFDAGEENLRYLVANVFGVNASEFLHTAFLGIKTSVSSSVDPYMNLISTLSGGGQIVVSYWQESMAILNGVVDQPKLQTIRYLGLSMLLDLANEGTAWHRAITIIEKIFAMFGVDQDRRVAAALHEVVEYANTVSRVAQPVAVVYGTVLGAKFTTSLFASQFHNNRAAYSSVRSTARHAYNTYLKLPRSRQDVTEQVVGMLSLYGVAQYTYGALEGVTLVGKGATIGMTKPIVAAAVATTVVGDNLFNENKLSASWLSSTLGKGIDFIGRKTGWYGESPAEYTARTAYAPPQRATQSLAAYQKETSAMHPGWKQDQEYDEYKAIRDNATPRGPWEEYTYQAVHAATVPNLMSWLGNTVSSVTSGSGSSTATVSTPVGHTNVTNSTESLQPTNKTGSSSHVLTDTGLPHSTPSSSEVRSSTQIPTSSSVLTSSIQPSTSTSTSSTNTVLSTTSTSSSSSVAGGLKPTPVNTKPATYIPDTDDEDEGEDVDEADRMYQNVLNSLNEKKKKQEL